MVVKVVLGFVMRRFSGGEWRYRGQRVGVLGDGPLRIDQSTANR